MDGQRLQAFWNQEVKSLLAVYKQFETLLPNPNAAGAEHRGEDGRYVETLVRAYLQKYLPKDLEVLTGFILRPAVKLGNNDRSRSGEQDLHTTQLDIIVYDSGIYPVFQRMVDTVIVPPEGVVAVLSIKKTLRDAEIVAECNALLDASKACRCDDSNVEARRRGPFLALVATDSDLADKREKKEKKLFEKLKILYGSNSVFDDMVGFIGDLSAWHVFKTRPPLNLTPKNSFAKYMYVELNDSELHQGFQFILSGILSVYYDKTRGGVKRPGYTAFAPKPATEIGKIYFSSLR
ncbi:DUF6602 domain-containing protein [Rhizobium sp. L1K21]|uniref:DUF6602 domain-containing protein n=1 Tax=Rhizobium sp. L1K21 TaxID=2954933 RepID=UPI002093D6E2|nr:DUF6602 domain-containing protein [Rhizobium sp. L1K21]MCO6185561.1 hypothetical protein [Rhizobium sp. L1K21]